MAALPWGVVIIDESHNLRTTNSRQADSPHTGGQDSTQIKLLADSTSSMFHLHCTLGNHQKAT